jgi:hypothetical protein
MFFIKKLEQVFILSMLGKALGHGLQGTGTYYYSGKSSLNQVTGERMLATGYSQGVGALSLYPPASGLELVMGHNQGGSAFDLTYHEHYFS